MGFFYLVLSEEEGEGEGRREKRRREKRDGYVTLKGFGGILCLGGLDVFYEGVAGLFDWGIWMGYMREYWGFCLGVRKDGGWKAAAGSRGSKVFRMRAGDSRDAGVGGREMVGGWSDDG